MNTARVPKNKQPPRKLLQLAPYLVVMTQFRILAFHGESPPALGGIVAIALLGLCLASSASRIVIKRHYCMYH